ncbi:gamma-glutamyl phosphate reductase [Campylobacter sputorum subsp. bubulus]|uniref:Gamma-glutamyl phosphate reductase n=1 Tax=Campylobacter sputorum subsp. sputorum TaxID=32024 RepID=A0A381DHL5_9BACT|nr:glutamate-5-semialdehyde dehydrogenase [Campylobacter sputorum]ASM35238.1 glutamate-5-semialdehyde dehydrogenase [Campylobacter sputorum aubsp. sputorum RM3237]KAB0580856.1 glutamate-5-semialdehyde dehydrogenase [Campylobacter sputorum subsp. sputorum]QEL05429.1 glutamate-5-semialdehyde dehydrogenase [Campylobacter sputorum subsp. sputorum]SUX08756.1 gamma-glutamyl phosphate reductase [Campylobacter sputorum subsp. bubulus]SUX10145.1 gamma-glutamyl phosphate reductase [Campylobacter sputoru
MIDTIKKARQTSKTLLELNPQTKKNVILDMSEEISKSKKDILSANKIDMQNAISLSKAMQDRLMLDEKRINDIANSLKIVANLQDPIGNVLSGWINYAGLKINKVSIPIGVIGIIYESRPNVTAEVASLCLKSSNVCLLKGGKEALNSNLAIIKALHKSLEKFNIPAECISYLNISRQDVKKFLKMDKYIDLIIPRGGENLVKMVSNTSKIPVIKHDKGLCHAYVDEFADLKKALDICVNAKFSKPSACNSIETILIHKNIADKFLPMLKTKFDELKIHIKGCNQTAKFINCEKATNKDFDTEYLDYAVNLKVVSSIDEAIAHIEKFSSSHSEVIISKNEENIQKFLNLVDSACVYVNTSTRFSDGGEFGFGAEIGISTNKLHARGPMGLNELTTYKYQVLGNGQVR